MLLEQTGSLMALQYQQDERNLERNMHANAFFFTRNAPASMCYGARSAAAHLSPLRLLRQASMSLNGSNPNGRRVSLTFWGTPWGDLGVHLKRWRCNTRL